MSKSGWNRPSSRRARALIALRVAATQCGCRSAEAGVCPCLCACPRPAAGRRDPVMPCGVVIGPTPGESLEQVSAGPQGSFGRPEHHGSVHVDGELRRPLPAEGPGSGLAAGDQIVAQLPVVADTSQCLRQVARRHAGGVEDGVAANLGDGGNRQRDHRCAQGHRLEQREAESLIDRRVDQGLGTLVERGQLLLRDAATIDDARGAFAGQAFVGSQPLRCLVADQDQGRGLLATPPSAPKFAVRDEQVVDVLVRKVGCHREEVAARHAEPRRGGRGPAAPRLETDRGRHRAA